MRLLPGLILLSTLCVLFAITPVAQTTPDYIPVVLWHGEPFLINLISRNFIHLTKMKEWVTPAAFHGVWEESKD